MMMHSCSFWKALRCCLERPLPGVTVISHCVKICSRKPASLCSLLRIPGHQKDDLSIWEKPLARGTYGTFSCARAGCAFQCPVKVKGSVLRASHSGLSTPFCHCGFLVSNLQIIKGAHGKSFYRNEHIVSIPAFLFWGQGERENVTLCHLKCTHSPTGCRL